MANIDPIQLMQAQNEKLKAQQEHLMANKASLEHTVSEVMKSSIDFRTSIFNLDKRLKEANAKLEKVEKELADLKKKEIEEGEKKLAELKAQAEEGKIQGELDLQKANADADPV